MSDKTTGEETMRLVAEWMKSGLSALQVDCYTKLIEDNFENDSQKLDAMLNAIACVGMEKIIEITKQAQDAFEEEKKKRQLFGAALKIVE